MSITLPSENQVYDYLIALFLAQSPTDNPWDLSDKSWYGLQARAIAQSIMLLMDAVADADNDAVPAYKQDSDGTLLSKCSTDALDAWAITLGLPSGTAGVYGRKGARGSSGGVALPTTTAGAILIAAGTQFVDSTGQITIQTTGAVTTDGPPNTQTLSLESVTTGTQANLAQGLVLTFVTPIANVASTVTLSTGLSGGQDRETDGQLLARILYRLQNPPRGGTAADYRIWAEESTDATQNDKSNNIFRAYVFPLRLGIGTVDVLPLVSGSGTSRKPGAATVAAVLAYLQLKRPVTATVNVIEAYMPAARALRVRIILKPYEKYAADWDDLKTPTTVTAHNIAAKTITVAAIPANLQAAVTAGKKPRISVSSVTAGMSAKPYQARVTAAAAGVLTLESWPFPTGIALTNGTDYFFAGGPYVDTIATNLLAFVDQLGPSRESGYADVYDVWEYGVNLARIADIVMEARDSDGTRFIKNIPNLPTTGITIAIGAGAFAATDFTPLDVLGCELAYLRAGGIDIVGSG